MIRYSDFPRSVSVIERNDDGSIKSFYMREAMPMDIDDRNEFMDWFSTRALERAIQSGKRAGN